MSSPSHSSAAASPLPPPASSLPPLALYIHFPWCIEKCPYCDFNSHAVKGKIPEAAYLAALQADLDSLLPQIQGRSLHSIFFGGGTPSLISPAGIASLLTTLHDRQLLSPATEITLEANPGTAEAGHFAAYRSAGITRLSLGIQSFSDSCLRALGRVHDAGEARAAAELAARHFENFNLDLMVGLPGQDMAGAMNDLETALALAPTHLSAYQLTLEPNTRFAAFPPAGLPDADLAADMQDAIEARLAEAGFVHYETSAFARPGRQSRHNLNYWLFGDYLGIGAGAHGKLSSRQDSGLTVLRQMRHKSPQAYLAAAATGNFIQEERRVAGSELPGEFMMNALRLLQGFDPALFAARTGLPLTILQASLDAAVADGLLEVSATRIAPSDSGRHFLNRLLGYFL